ncbi:MAG: TlpA family protein disulfide reductase [bacterium]|nr:TlpA family protein disulfide reductase [bacterium]
MRTNRQLNRLWSTVLCLAVALGAALAVTPAGASNYVGDVMDDFTLLDVNGVPVSLYDFAGDIIVVNFFATWCPGCNDEAQSLENDIWQEYREDGVTVLSIDLQEQLAVVLPWIASQGVTYRVLMAPNWNVFSRFPYAGGLPYNAIIDRDMVLRYGHVFYERDIIVGMLDELLGRAPVSTETTSWGSVQALFR